MASLSRRTFLQQSCLVTAGFLGLRTLANSPLLAARLEAAAAPLSAGFGPLLPDTAGLLDLPHGFRYVSFSAMGETMDDGLVVPGCHDGMAAFPGPDGSTILVRNHELESDWRVAGAFGPENALFPKVDPALVYDCGHGIRPNLGGTTTLVFDNRTQKLRKHFLSLAGTVRNCAGGPTPWGTWITCEEVNDTAEPDAEKAHGFNFEVRPSTEPGLTKPVPLKAMGRFRHEAIAVDPASGAVYQTEDIGNGLFYRFLPKERENLAAGGRLQALALVGDSGNDTRNWPGVAKTFPIGKRLPVRWIDMEDVESPKGDLRERGYAAGATLFARAEGAWQGHDSVYFACTNGGPKLLGQIFRYRPSPFEGTDRESERPGELELFIESTDSALLSNCDNLTLAPWGDVIVCEDTSGACRIIGITPEGQCYAIARNPVPKRELAGVCFSPDGSTLFVNIQNPGRTFAITGTWKRGG